MGNVQDHKVMPSSSLLCGFNLQCDMFVKCYSLMVAGVQTVTSLSSEPHQPQPQNGESKRPYLITIASIHHTVVTLTRMKRNHKGLAVWLLFLHSCNAFVHKHHVRVTPQVSSPSTTCKGRLLTTGNDCNEGKQPTKLEKIASSLSTSVATKVGRKYRRKPMSSGVELVTLIRVGIPSILVGIVAFAIFPALSLFLARLFSLFGDAGVFAVLSQDSSQFVQNFLTVASLLFSILVGQTFYFMYQQQEMVFYALFSEVTEAKSLLEQVALVCQGRSMYKKVLAAISTYVREDLKQLQADPAILLSARPVDDPLESIMYMTSVGVPSTVYETVRSLRQARAGRLGALQRKLPPIHMLLLWILSAIILVSFPLLGAGTQIIGGYNILTVEGALFGVMAAGIVMTLRVVGELWRPAGGAYNVDKVLSVMVRGLEDELKARMEGSEVFASKGVFPSPAIDAEFLKQTDRDTKDA